MIMPNEIPVDADSCQALSAKTILAHADVQRSPHVDAERNPFERFMSLVCHPAIPSMHESFSGGSLSSWRRRPSAIALGGRYAAAERSAQVTPGCWVHHMVVKQL